MTRHNYLGFQISERNSPRNCTQICIPSFLTNVWPPLIILIKDAEINVSRSDLNQSSNHGRPWEKPSSTCSGPDDGYSTERAGDCGSSKTESGSKLPHRSEAAVLQVGESHTFGHVTLGSDFVDSDRCQAYVNENRVETERLYSTLQTNRNFNRFSTFQGQVNYLTLG